MRLITAANSNLLLLSSVANKPSNSAFLSLLSLFPRQLSALSSYSLADIGKKLPCQKTLSSTYQMSVRHRRRNPGVLYEPLKPIIMKPEEFRQDKAERMQRWQERQNPNMDPDFDEPPSPLESRPDDQPLRLDPESQPYVSEKTQCILCKYKIDLDYKNSRLLSQFVSSFSGRLYEKHITGLCEFQQQRVKKAIFESRKAGYMPPLSKDGRFLKDPKLFDPMNPQRPNPW